MFQNVAGSSLGPCQVTKAFDLPGAERASSTRIELLEDNRLSIELQQKMWGIGNWSYVLSSDSTEYSRFQANPPRNAVLKIVGISGKVVAERKLDAPLAKIDKLDVGDVAPCLFLLTVDHSVGFGSYAGLVTKILDPCSRQLRDVKAADSSGGPEKPIVLSRAAKSDWRLGRSGGILEILAVVCQPKFEKQQDFQISYVRYGLDNGRWMKFERDTDGLWESGDEFPPRSSFP
ncbi:MAG: hypothetical protein ACRD5R_07325 [Candidatus Acidiferrales bacterium]